MKLGIKPIKAIIFPFAISGIGYGVYNTIKDAKNYKSVDELKTEILNKAPKLYDSLTHDGVSRVSYQDWSYEVCRMNDSIKNDSMIHRAYFAGAQMVRDSIIKTERAK